MRGNTHKTYVIEPEQFGFKRCHKEELIGGSPEENARITRDILNGKKGPQRDAVVLNSAAAIYTAKPNITLPQAIQIAAETIDSGKAMEQLEKFVRLSRNSKSHDL
ncbi:MAG: hypothetical protein Pg6A_20390 [Termitinemataceae bacterium]|nr:MAG: hypothetical protein Pg6A_20390 [Termitinemataceae bacterium]